MRMQLNIFVSVYAALGIKKNMSDRCNIPTWKLRTFIYECLVLYERKLTYELLFFNIASKYEVQKQSLLFSL